MTQPNESCLPVPPGPAPSRDDELALSRRLHATVSHDDLTESQRAWLNAVTEVRARRQEERRSRQRVLLGANRKVRTSID